METVNKLLVVAVLVLASVRLRLLETASIVKDSEVNIQQESLFPLSILLAVLMSVLDASHPPSRTDA